MRDYMIAGSWWAREAFVNVYPQNSGSLYGIPQVSRELAIRHRAPHMGPGYRIRVIRRAKD